MPILRGAAVGRITRRFSVNINETTTTSAFRQRSTAAGRTSIAATARQPWNRIRSRGYATGGDHGHAPPSSDLPWLIGSVAVTVPLCWWIGIYTPDPNAHHDEHGEHGEHEEHGEQEESHDESGEEEQSTSSKSASESDGNDNSEGAEQSGSEDEKQDTPDTSDDEGETGKNKSGAPDDEPSTVKPPGDMQSTTSGKQEGISNADTRHSTDIGNDPTKSKKPEEGPDTAKAKGTVKSERPQV